MNTNTMELNIEEMALVNGGLNKDPDELLNATLNGWGAGSAIGAVAGTVIPVVGTGLGFVVGGAAGSVVGLALKLFGG
jgi:hypothetical protein